MISQCGEKVILNLVKKEKGTKLCSPPQVVLASYYMLYIYIYICEGHYNTVENHHPSKA